MKTRIDDCIVEAKSRLLSSANPELSGIIGCLEVMKVAHNDDGRAKSKLAGALGRLVMEDYSFAESVFGGRLLKLADDFVIAK